MIPFPSPPSNAKSTRLTVHWAIVSTLGQVLKIYTIKFFPEIWETDMSIPATGEEPEEVQ